MLAVDREFENWYEDQIFVQAQMPDRGPVLSSIKSYKFYQSKDALIDDLETCQGNGLVVGNCRGLWYPFRDGKIIAEEDSSGSYGAIKLEFKHAGAKDVINSTQGNKEACGSGYDFLWVYDLPKSCHGLMTETLQASRFDSPFKTFCNELTTPERSNLGPMAWEDMRTEMFSYKDDLLKVESDEQLFGMLISPDVPHRTKYLSTWYYCFPHVRTDYEKHEQMDLLRFEDKAREWKMKPQAAPSVSQMRAMTGIWCLPYGCPKNRLKIELVQRIAEACSYSGLTPPSKRDIFNAIAMTGLEKWDESPPPGYINIIAWNKAGRCDPLALQRALMPVEDLGEMYGMSEWNLGMYFQMRLEAQNYQSHLLRLGLMGLSLMERVPTKKMF